MEEQGLTLEYKVGTMIEIPRACLTADEIAEKLISSVLVLTTLLK